MSSRTGGRSPKSSKAHRPPLTRDQVLRAAVKLADSGGIKSLSMRKLAHSVGVEAMSLYNHVPNKDEILSGIVELVAQEIDLAEDETDWRIGMRRRVMSAHQLLSIHPWAATIWMTSGTPGTGRLGFGNAVLGGLRKAGFSTDVVYHAFHVLQSHLLGYTLAESNFELDEDQLKKVAKRFLENFPAEQYPDLAEHIRHHMEPTEAHKDTFAFGLDLILNSLERLR
ncbi:MAG TPA: TetR/AcrR family transcriptional regulator C-terminal domain-containing protein [Actinomycetota bacterium]|nr:TetR/AcrR family transcriptional regulator C-terminal domain-containing protein [Actinomycetota bacterium]